MIRQGIRYITSLVALVARQRKYRTASMIAVSFPIREAAKLPRYAFLVLVRRARHEGIAKHPTMYSEALVDALMSLGVEVETYHINMDAFQAHVAACDYPSNYAAGPMDEGGSREEKMLEYFLSLDLLHVRSTDIVVDVASEWSIFPEIVRNLTGAKVYAQDQIYPPGVKGEYIGGSATHMPVPEGFADKLVLHNAFEHFEGTADIEFIAEAWRVLKPGGVLCILPLFMTDHHTIITDPLVNRRGIVWDEGARVVDLPWWHNRFGRFYDAKTLQQRVLIPGGSFNSKIYHIVNVKEAHPCAYLHFALVMQKPKETPPQ